MKRTTISLPEDVAVELEREAARRRVSVSKVAREAIEKHLGPDEAEPRWLSFIGIADGESDRRVDAADLDDYLEKHWADDIRADSFNSDR